MELELELLDDGYALVVEERPGHTAFSLDTIGAIAGGPFSVSPKASKNLLELALRKTSKRSLVPSSAPFISSSMVAALTGLPFTDTSVSPSFTPNLGLSACTVPEPL